MHAFRTRSRRETYAVAPLQGDFATQRKGEGHVPGDSVGYCRPYDIETDQEHFMHSKIGDRRSRSWLMYRNRDKVIPRLEKLLEFGLPVLACSEFVAQDLEVGRPTE